MSLRKVSLNPEAVLFEAVASLEKNKVSISSLLAYQQETHLINQLRLLHLVLMKTFNTILDNLPPLLDTLRKCG